LNIDVNAEDFRAVVVALDQAAKTNVHTFVDPPESVNDEITAHLRVGPADFTEAFDITRTETGAVVVMDFPDHEPHLREAGQAFHLNPVGFMGREESDIRRWPRSKGQEASEADKWHMDNTCKRLLERVAQEMAHGMNRSLGKMLTTAAKSHGKMIEGPHIKDEVLSMTRDGWTLLHSGVAVDWTDYTDIRPRRARKYIPDGTGLLIAPPEELGYWYGPLKGDLTSWADPKNLELGITAVVGFGAAVYTSKVITVQFGGA
jgi:hypothetical protein